MLGRTLSISAVIALALAHPAAALTAEEQAVVDAINAARVDAGLAPLTVSEELSAVADTHSGAMAASDSLFHSDLTGVAVDSTHVGENVGMGYSIESINAAFLASPEHAANIYGDYASVGVGVETNPGGKLFVTEVFASGATTESAQPQPQPTASTAPAVQPALSSRRATPAHAAGGMRRHGPPEWAKASERGRAASARPLSSAASR